MSTENTDSLWTWTAAVTAYLGGFGLNEWATIIGITLGIIRIPVEMNRLIHVLKEKNKK